MGAKYRASCECGYFTEVNAAGDMSCQAEASRFPFYCANCGLVEVDTGLSAPVCPNCGRADIAQYGQPPVPVGHSHKYPESQEPMRGMCPACNQALVFRELDPAPSPERPLLPR